jgi:hypothetical protein
VSGSPITNIDELKKYASRDGGADFYIGFIGGMRSSKHISYDGTTFFVSNEIDNTEDELNEEGIMDKSKTNIGEAINNGGFFIYDFEIKEAINTIEKIVPAVVAVEEGAVVESDRGWWKLTFTGVNELNDIDREHIAKLIVDGFTEGEIIHA